MDEELIPSLEETYHPGVILHLHPGEPLPKPSSEDGLNEDGKPRYMERSIRYQKSINERVVLRLSAPPTLAIILEQRFVSGMEGVSHAWTARVQDNNTRVASTSRRTADTVYPPLLVAKIIDPLFFDDYEANFFDPFVLRDISVYREVRGYHQLEHLQGTLLAQFYGLFTASLPAQFNRTVHVVLLEKVPGLDLRHVIPPEVADNVCSKHRNAILDSAINLFLDVAECRVMQLDMQPRNIILRRQKRVGSGVRFCNKDDCPVAFKVDSEDLHLVMIDLESVNFSEFTGELDSSEWISHPRQERFDWLKQRYLKEEWLAGRMH